MYMKNISIIIATYNAAKTLKTCLDSIVPQLCAETELIIVDGGSKDNTNDIIKSYGDKVSVHISEPDKGIYDAWNKGVALSHGDWIMFIGADDRLRPNAVNIYLEKIKKVPNECLLISCKRDMYSLDGKLVRTVGNRWEWPSCIKGMPISHPGALHSKKLFNEVGLFDISYRISGDYELLMRKATALNAEFIDVVNIDVYEGGISDSYAAIREYYKTLKNSQLLNRTLALRMYFVMYIKYTVKSFLRRLGINAHL